MKAKLYGFDRSFLHDTTERDPFVIDMVRAEDYLKLEAQVASLQEQVVFKENLTAEIVALQEQVRALAAESNKWKPEFCPVTKRPFFMWIEHPGGGMVPTYGGPYDSYTIPVVDSDGEFSCERYDHDEGAWVDGVCLSERLIDDQMHFHDDADLREIRAQAVDDTGDRIRLVISEFPESSHDIVEECACISGELAARIRSGEQP